MVAGIEPEQYATGHEMSNQRSEKQSFPNTNLDLAGKTGTTSRTHFSAMHNDKLY